METLTPEASPQVEASSPRRTRLIMLIAALAVAGIAIGTWAVIEADQSDGLTIAAQFADTWVEAVLASDGETAAALFTEDGVYDQTPAVALMQGRGNISLLVTGWGQYITELRHGQVTEIEDGVFVFPTQGVYLGNPFTDEMTITLEGDLVSHARVESQGD